MYYKMFLEFWLFKYKNFEFKTVKQAKAFKFVYNSGWEDGRKHQLIQHKLEKEILKQLKGKQVSSDV